MKDNVFISYSHEDRTYVERLAGELRGAGIPVWFDRELRVGTDWQARIHEEIGRCSVFLPVMSATSAKSTPVAEETKEALRLNKLIMPLSLDGEIFETVENLHAEIIEGGGSPSAGFVEDLRVAWEEATGQRTVQQPTSNPALMWQIALHTGQVRSLSFSEGGHLLASSGLDRKVQIRNSNTSGHVKTIEGTPEPGGLVAFLPHTSHLVAVTSYASPGLHIWDLMTGIRVRTVANHEVYGDEITTLAFTADGALVATGDKDGAVVWRVGDGELISRVRAAHTNPRWPLAFSPNGSTRLLIAHRGKVTGPAGIWNIVTGSLEHSLTGHRERVSCGAFSPDGTLVATGGTDATARVWDSTDGTQLHCLKGHNNAVTAVAFNRGGDYLFTGSVDRTIRIWRSRSGESLGRLTAGWAAGGVYALALSPDGTQLASGWGDGKVRTWDVTKAITNAIMAA